MRDANHRTIYVSQVIMLYTSTFTALYANCISIKLEKKDTKKGDFY